MRTRIANNGIADPMSLTSMHLLLDIVEAAALESIPKENERRLMLNKLYAPEHTAINGDGYQPAPAGFEDDSIEASFDAFMAVAR